jgi:uncharacterized protein (TIGR03437 family)
VLVSFNPSGAASLTPSSTPYVGTLTITPGGSNPVPVTVAITLTVTASPQVTVSPGGTSAAPLVFNWEAGATSNQTQQTLTLTSNATQAVSFNIIAPGVSWIRQVSPISGSIPANGSTQVTVQVDGSSQGQGIENGSFQIAITGALFPNGTTTQTISVQLNVSTYPLLYASQAQLTFTYQFGSIAPPSAQVVTPTSSGAPSQQLNYNVSVPSSTSWLTVPTGTLSTSGGSFQVAVVTAGLSPGTYTSNVIVTPVANGSGQAAIVIPVTLNVVFGNTLQVSTQSLVFPWEVGQAAPAAQTVTISSSTGAPLNYVVSAPSPSAAPWVQVNGSLGGVTDQTSISVGINTAGVPSPPPSTYLDATINIAATDPVTNNAVNSVSIDVRLYATTAPQLVVSPSGPLQFFTYPNYPGYPLSNTATVNLSSTSSLASDVLGGISLSRTVTSQASTGNWLGGTSPGPQSPTSFTVNGTVLGSAMPVGTYTGNIAISATTSTGTAVADSPVSVPVTFVVDAAKGSVITPGSNGSILFSQAKGGQAPASQTVQVLTDGPALGFDAVVNTGLLNWLTISSLSSPTPGSFNVSANAANLTTGTYTGAIWVTIPNAAGSPIRIPVTFNVTGGAIAASPSSLSFTQIVGGSAPAAQSVQVTLSPSTSSAIFTVSTNVTTPANGTWLSASITAGGGSTPGTVTVAVTPGSLAAGNYTGNVVIASNGATGSPISIPVTLTVEAATITASTTPLTFNQLAGGAAPASQSVSVTSTPGPVSFTVASTTTSGGSWLAATAGSSGTTGTTPGTVQISVNGSSLSPGAYSGFVTITSSGSNGSPISIPVALNVGAAAVLSVTQQSLSFNASVGQATTPQTVQLTSTATAPYTVSTATKDNGTWLSVSPSSGTAGTTAITLTISANTQNLAAGSYSGTVTISSSIANTPVTINVGLTVVSIPTPVLTSIVNAASYQAGAVSPGENISIFGTGIGPATLAKVQQLTASGTFPTTIGNTQVLFDGLAAPILYASATQTSVMVPYEIGGRTSTNIQVVYSGVASAALPYSVVQSVPGIYTQNSQGFGPGSIINPDGTLNGPNNPAAKGSVVAIYMTGEGATSPASTTGAIASTPGNPLNKPILVATATIAGLPAPVQYYGSAPDIVYGVMQVNVLIPANTPTGAQTLVVNVGNNATQANVTVAVQ